MVAEEAILNLSNFTGSLPSSWTFWLKSALGFFGALSLFFIVSTIYVIVSLFLNIRRARRIKRMEEKLDKIYSKLNKKK